MYGCKFRKQPADPMVATRAIDEAPSPHVFLRRRHSEAVCWFDSMYVYVWMLIRTYQYVPHTYSAGVCWCLFFYQALMRDHWPGGCHLCSSCHPLIQCDASGDFARREAGSLLRIFENCLRSLAIRLLVPLSDVVARRPASNISHRFYAFLFQIWMGEFGSIAFLAL